MQCCGALPRSADRGRLEETKSVFESRLERALRPTSAGNDVEEKDDAPIMMEKASTPTAPTPGDTHSQYLLPMQMTITNG